MMAEQALVEIGGGNTNTDEMFFLPLLSEVPKEKALAPLENRKLAGPDLVNTLGEDDLGFLLIGSNRLSTLPPVRPVISDDPPVTPPDDAHYVAPRTETRR